MKVVLLLKVRSKHITNHIALRLELFNVVQQVWFKSLSSQFVAVFSCLERSLSSFATARAAGAAASWVFHVSQSGGVMTAMGRERFLRAFGEHNIG